MLHSPSIRHYLMRTSPIVAQHWGRCMGVQASTAVPKHAVACWLSLTVRAGSAVIGRRDELHPLVQTACYFGMCVWILLLLAGDDKQAAGAPCTAAACAPVRVTCRCRAHVMTAFKRNVVLMVTSNQCRKQPNMLQLVVCATTSLHSLLTQC